MPPNRPHENQGVGITSSTTSCSIKMKTALRRSKSPAHYMTDNQCLACPSSRCNHITGANIGRACRSQRFAGISANPASNKMTPVPVACESLRMSASSRALHTVFFHHEGDPSLRVSRSSGTIAPLSYAEQSNNHLPPERSNTNAD
jgi:hypothetical protein